MGAKLVSDKFGQRAMEDAFMNQIVFDDENKCFQVLEKDGIAVIHDITQGMRMAAKTGMTQLDGLEVLLSKCGNCTKELTVGGDKVILYSKSGPEGKAVYWCKQCYKIEFEAIEGKPLSSTNFRKLSAEKSGRPFMTAGCVARNALYKLAKDVSGDGSQKSVDEMHKTFAAGLDAVALRKFRACVDEVAANCTNGRALLEHAAIQDYNRDLEDVWYEIRMQTERLWLYPTLGGGLDHRAATRNRARILVLRGVRRRVPLQLGIGRHRFTRPRQALPACYIYADTVGRRNDENDVCSGGRANPAAESGNPRPQGHHGRRRSLGAIWGEGGFDRIRDRDQHVLRRHGRRKVPAQKADGASARCT